jgi:hypothetical protein
MSFLFTTNCCGNNNVTTTTTSSISSVSSVTTPTVVQNVEVTNPSSTTTTTTTSDTSGLANTTSGITISKSTTTTETQDCVNPFVYGCKKVTFKLKDRSSTWSTENLNSACNCCGLNNSTFKHLMLNNQMIDYLLNEFNGQENYRPILKQPVSPVLALTLCLLNENFFKNEILHNYISSSEPQVYAWDETVTNKEMIAEEADGTNRCNLGLRYVKALPGYKHIRPVKIYHGYNKILKGVDYPVYEGPGFFPSYNFKIGEENFIVESDKDYKNDIMLNKPCDSYLVRQGFIKKLSKDFSGDIKTSYFETIRGGYGYGAMCIGAFLNSSKFDMVTLANLAYGILFAQDSGMVLQDAISVVNQLQGSVNPTLTGIDASLTSTVEFLKNIEMMGVFYLLSIITSSFSNYPMFYLPMSSNIRKVFDIGFKMGESYNNFKTFIQQYQQSTAGSELFSIYLPTIINKNGTLTSGSVNLLSTAANFLDISGLETKLFDDVLCIDDTLKIIQDLKTFINPVYGYKISDFIISGINKCLTNNILNAIEKFNEEKEDSDKMDVFKNEIPCDFNIAVRNDNGYNLKYNNPIYIDGSIYDSINLNQTKYLENKIDEDMKSIQKYYFNFTYDQVDYELIVIVEDSTDYYLINDNKINIDLKGLKTVIHRTDWKEITNDIYITTNLDLSFIKCLIDYIQEDNEYYKYLKKINWSLKLNDTTKFIILSNQKSQLGGYIGYMCYTTNYNSETQGGGTSSALPTENFNNDAALLSIQGDISNVIYYINRQSYYECTAVYNKCLELFMINNFNVYNAMSDIENQTTDETRREAIEDFIWKYALASSKISIINSFYDSYTTNSSYDKNIQNNYLNIFKDLIKEYVDITVSYCY